MYDIALSVAACLRAGTRVDVAWAVQAEGFASRDPNEALAITPGGGRIGAVLQGSANGQLAELAGQGRSGHLVSVTVGEFDAQLAGLACGGQARCLLVEAAQLPAGLWDRLRERDPVCLVAHLDGDLITSIELYDRATISGAGEEAQRRFGRGISDSLVADDAVITVLWPVPKLVIVGAGGVADAVKANAELLGWQVQTATDADAATGLIAGLAVLDNLVVVSHDLELAGTALAAALAGGVGYIGALGSRRTQQTRADWLAYRGVTDLSRVHGPAGLDIGSRTPPEIAVAILAEALAVRSGSSIAPRQEPSGAVPSS